MRIPFNIPPVVGTEKAFIDDAINRRKLCGDNFYTKECSKLIEAKYHTKKALLLVLNVFIYTRVDYRFGVVINSMSTVFVMLLSHIILKESITRKRIVGNILIVCGILVFMFF